MGPAARTGRPSDRPADEAPRGRVERRAIRRHQTYAPSADGQRQQAADRHGHRDPDRRASGARRQAADRDRGARTPSCRRSSPGRAARPGTASWIVALAVAAIVMPPAPIGIISGERQRVRGRDRQRDRRDAEHDGAGRRSATGLRPATDDQRDRGHQRPEPGCRHQEPVPGRVAAEDVLGERRDEDAEVHAERRDEPDDGHGRSARPGCGGRTARPSARFSKTAPTDWAAATSRARCSSSSRIGEQPDDDRDEARGVDREGDGDPEGADRQSGHGRTDDARAVEHRGVDAHGVADVLAARPSRRRTTGGRACRRRWRSRAGSRAGRSSRSRPGPSQRRTARTAARTIITTWTASSVWRLGRTSARIAGEQAQDHDRQELRGGHDAQPQRVAAADRQDEPCLGDLLHPGADERDGLPAEEQPKVAMPERATSPWCAGDASRRERGRAGHRPAPAGRVGAVAGVRIRAAVEVGQVLVEVAASGAGVLDHRVEAGALRLERGDLTIDAGHGVAKQGSSLGLVTGRAEAQPVALAGRLVLEQLADLGQREAGVVAQAADEPQALEVGRVEQPIRPIGARGGLQEPDLFVVTDRAGRQAGLGGDVLDPQQSSPVGVRSGSSAASPR